MTEWATPNSSPQRHVRAFLLRISGSENTSAGWSRLDKDAARRHREGGILHLGGVKGQGACGRPQRAPPKLCIVEAGSGSTRLLKCSLLDAPYDEFRRGGVRGTKKESRVYGMWV